MRAFISERVREGTNPLPRGAVEAEFARHKARAIRTGLDEPISFESIVVEERPAGPARPVAVTNALPLVDAVTRAEEAMARLMCLSETQVGITFFDVSQLMGITVKRLKRVKRRDGWRLLRPHRGNEPVPAPGQGLDEARGSQLLRMCHG